MILRQPNAVIALPRGVTDSLLKLALVTALLVAAAFAHAAPAARSQPSPIEPTTIAYWRFESGHVLDHAFARAMKAFEAGDHETAVKLWRPLAEQGHAISQFNLGIVYATGKGTTVDMQHAVHWWQLAAYQGNTDAQYNLGLIYFEGNGVPKNPVRASMWWYMAAMGGDPAAQFHLGAMAVNGDAGPQSIGEAAWWWHLSARQGFNHAIKALEILKENGVVVEK